MKIGKSAALLLVIICSIFLLKEDVQYYIYQSTDQDNLYTYSITNNIAQIYEVKKEVPVYPGNCDTYDHKEIFGFIGMYVILARLSNIKSRIIIFIKSRNVKKD